MVDGDGLGEVVVSGRHHVWSFEVRRKWKSGFFRLMYCYHYRFFFFSILPCRNNVILGTAVLFLNKTSHAKQCFVLARFYFFKWRSAKQCCFRAGLFEKNNKIDLVHFNAWFILLLFLLSYYTDQESLEDYLQK